MPDDDEPAALPPVTRRRPFGVSALMERPLISAFRVMNKAVAIPAALVLIAALVGGTLMGVIGVLVALPVTASILLVIREVIIPKQDLKVN